MMKFNNVTSKIENEFKRLGLTKIGNAVLAPNGTDAHIGRTLRRGCEPYLETNQYEMVNGYDGIHVVDASIFPEIPSKYITLTTMANADRIGRALRGMDK